MGVPRVYRKQGERAIISFDFFSFTNGLGYTDFFCFSTQDNSSKKLNILNKVFKSSVSHSILGSGGGSIEFTTTFNQTKIMKGKGLFQFHWAFKDNGGGSTGFATISMEKNGVEIVSARGQDLTSSSNISRLEIIEMDIPITKFSRDDIWKIKLTITISGGTQQTFIAHDPEDGAWTPVSPWTGSALADSIFKASIPFKVVL